mmetsp:Transcript_16719/g.31377  ORF Transcript_16719/g.31377 Transcript_16719/m.31377 type:complete len:278 (-) Transcript_16719:1309-2142(-)
MHSKHNILSVLLQLHGNIRCHTGGLGHGKTVSGGEQDLLRLLEHLSSISGVDLSMDEVLLGSSRGTRGHSTKSSKNNIRKGSVHGLAHDAGQESSRGSNESTNNGEEGLVEDESLSTQRPTGVRVEQSDDHRHIGTSNRSGHVETKNTTGNGTSSQASSGGGRTGRGAEPNKGSGRHTSKTKVDGISTRKGQSIRAQLLSELSVGNDGASGGDGTHPGAKVGGDIVESINMGGIMHHVVTHSSGSGGNTDQRVESSHCLRELSGGDLGGDVVTKTGS